MEMHPDELAKFRKLGELKEALAKRVHEIGDGLELLPDFSTFFIQLQTVGEEPRLLVEVHSPLCADVNEQLLSSKLRWSRAELNVEAGKRWRR